MGNTVHNTLSDLKDTTKEDMIHMSDTLSGTGEKLLETTTYISEMGGSFINKTHAALVNSTNYVISTIEKVVPFDYSIYKSKPGSWVSLEPLQTDLKHGKLFYYKKRLYILGVHAKKWNLWCYSMEKHIWTELTCEDAPIIRFGCSIVHYHDYLVIWGGFYRENSNHVDILHLGSLHWAQSPAIQFPLAREGHSAVIYRNFMVVFGGYQVDHHKYYYNNVLFLNLSNMEWYGIEGEGSLPAPRSGHGACALDSEMYIFGGSCENDHKIFFNDLYALNFATQKWKLIQTLDSPSKRMDMSLNASRDGWIHMYGGWCENGAIVNDFWTWNGRNWVKRDITGPNPRFQHSMIVENHTLILYGGIDWVQSEFKTRQDLCFMEMRRWIGLDVYFEFLEFDEPSFIEKETRDAVLIEF